jgi:hypothetical protein
MSTVEDDSAGGRIGRCGKVREAREEVVREALLLQEIVERTLSRSEWRCGDRGQQ